MEKLRRIVRMKDVYEFCGLRRTALQKEIAAGRFPAPFALTPGGRAKAVSEESLLAWQKQRLAARDRKTDAE